MKRALPMMALAIASIAAGPAHVPPENRAAGTEPPEPDFVPRQSSKVRFGWLKSPDCPKHRSKAERNKRKAARRARARNAKGGR